VKSGAAGKGIPTCVGMTVHCSKKIKENGAAHLKNWTMEYRTVFFSILGLARHSRESGNLPATCILNL
jgi:hypothetical protein